MNNENNRKKEILTNGNIQSFLFPTDAKILKVGVQDTQVTIWAELEIGAEYVVRNFQLFGTGWEIDDTPRTYIETVFVDGFVWHVYENIIEERENN